MSEINQPANATPPSREPAAPLFLFGRFLSWLIFRCYNRMEVAGQKNLPPHGGVLLIANHTSYVDPPIVGAATPRPVHFMAKAELFFFPLGAIIRRTHAFPVKRGGAGNREALRTAVRMLKEGKVLLIFPEGTRSPTGALIPLEQGAAFVALSAGTQVVPVGLDGADKILPYHGHFLRPAKLRVRIGPPVALDDLRGERLTRDVLQTATDRMTEALRGVLPAERQGN